MGLYALDFFSSSPNNYIFQKSANQTNFGGVCFLLTVVGIIAFSVYCFVDFHYQEQYSLDYINHINDEEHEKQGIYDLIKNLNLTMTYILIFISIILDLNYLKIFSYGIKDLKKLFQEIKTLQRK